jgi:predicted nucleic acid-binding protein
VSYLVDTNVISEVRRGGRCNANVAAWYASVDDEDIYLSVLVLGEIRSGIERARQRDRLQAEALEKWLVKLQTSFADRLLMLDRSVAEEWGRMSARRPVPVVDALLAATAKVHGLTLTTRNIADVHDLGADLLNPFEPVVGRV